MGLDNPFDDTANALAKKVASSGYPELSTRVSYAYSDETIEQKFGWDKLPRLIDLKNRWDPNNIFGYCNSIST